MVDRITPATGERELKIASEEFGIDDNFPVFCEEFRQWVLEDHFSAGRPAFETVGVTMTKDVEPYERMKIRILNGGHAIIAYPAGLMDIHFVHEAMEVPLIVDFLEKMETEEIIPIVPPVPDTDLEEYFAKVRHRFANPKIGDTIRRLCLDGSNRQPKFILPSTADRLKRGLPDHRPGARIRALVPLLLRRNGQRQGDRAERPQLGPPAEAREGGEGRPDGLPRHGRHLRRCRQVGRLPQGLRPFARHALGGRHQGNPDALPGGQSLTRAGPPGSGMTRRAVGWISA